MAGFATLFDWDFSEETSLPATYEALQEWKVAVEAGFCHDRKPGCRERAIEHYYRIAEMDSNFTLPLTNVAYESYATNCARVDSIASRLRPRIGRLPPVDEVQLRIATSICHGDLSGALDAAHGGTEGAPNNKLLPSLKALMLLFSNRPREVLGILEPVDMTQALEPPRDIAVLLGAYHRLGMYERALTYIANLRQIKPNTNADMRHLYLSEETASLAALGRVAEIGKQLNEAVRQLGPEERGLTVAYMMEQTGQELAAHGHPAEAREVFDRGIAWVRAQQGEQAGRDHRRALAGMLNSAGRWDEALALYRTLAIEDSSDTDVLAALGDLASRRGDRAEADRIDGLLSARGRTDPGGATGEYWSLYQRARIAGLLGKHATAMSLLHEAAQKGFTGWRVAHLDPDLAPMRDDPAFQDWIRPKD